MARSHRRSAAGWSAIRWLVCVADVFDALTSDRPYRKAFATHDALRMMQADTGRAFDPDVLAAFMRIVHKLPGVTPAVPEVPEVPEYTLPSSTRLVLTA